MTALQGKTSPRVAVYMLGAALFGVVLGWYLGTSSGSLALEVLGGGGVASAQQFPPGLLGNEVRMEFVPKAGEPPQIFEGTLHLKPTSGGGGPSTVDRGGKWFARDPEHPGKTTTVFIGIPTAPGNAQKRNMIREYCFPAYRVYPQVVGFGFFVGKPPLSNSKSKDELPMGDDLWLAATPEEQETEKALKEEAAKHGDFYIEGFRDKYEDLTLKTMAIFEEGVRSGADIIVKVDDDMCVMVEQVLQLVDESLASARASKVELYGGNEYIEWNGLGDSTHYQQGSAYFLSHELAKTIFVTDREETVLYGDYGHWAEDVNVGRWVNAAKTRHNMTVLNPYRCRIMQGAKWKRFFLEGDKETQTEKAKPRGGGSSTKFRWEDRERAAGRKK